MRSEEVRRVRDPRRRLNEEASERNELLAEGLEELWEPDHIGDSEDALSRALREIVDPQ
jgi:hypothetical protein